MEEVRERRRLCPELHSLGVVGVALLRLHASRNLEGVDECMTEIRELMKLIDRNPTSVEVRNPMLGVVSGYQRWAEVYDSPNPLVECEEPAVQRLLDGFSNGPVLDAACGTGRHLAYLTKQGRHAIGIDISRDMLEKAREKVPKADLRLGDLLDLPLKDSRVGAVVCALALEHIADLSAAYQELARVAAPGAPIVVSTMHPVLRSIYGWGAQFVDSNGRADIYTYAHRIEDHVNAASASGLILRHCEEPIFSFSSLPTGVSRSTRIAYTDVPMVLVLGFERPDV